MQANKVIVDVSQVVPRERHPKVFSAWTSLPDGEAMVLVNDHDPVPLYYQFAAEYCGRFRWEYLERGPELWRVQISKGDYPDPGFMPGLNARAPIRRVPETTKPPLVLDVKPVFARGASPCTLIDEAVASLAPGQSFVLLVPFEPVPLFTKLGAKGLSHKSEIQPDGSYRIVFTPGNPVMTPAVGDGGCGCPGH